MKYFLSRVLFKHSQTFFLKLKNVRDSIFSFTIFFQHTNVGLFMGEMLGQGRGRDRDDTTYPQLSNWGAA